MKTKKIVHFSDTLNLHHLIRKTDIPRCDIAIFSGNATKTGSYNDLDIFFKWFNQIPAEYKVFVPGNKDSCVERAYEPTKKVIDEFLLSDFLKNNILIDDLVTIDGLNIYGTPYVNHGTRGDFAFALFNDAVITKKYREIPDITNILVTTSPPYHVMDMGYNKEHIGSMLLRDIAIQLPQLKLHCFGKAHDNGFKDGFYHSYSNGTLTGESGDMIEYHPHIFEIEYD